MIIDPYKVFPVAPTVAILTPEADVVDEHGDRHDPDAVPAGTRVWASYEDVYTLVRAGVGEALCWNQEEIRWRHGRLDEAGWRSRPSDVAVVKLPFPEQVEAALAGLVTWRDWLSSYGASPTGTTGSAAWSLLRARLDRRLYCSGGDVPPIRWTLGGRQQLGPGGVGAYEGEIEHLDIQAAYARTIGELRYGGRWARTSRLGEARPAAFWAASGAPVFVRARVSVPASVAFGPLPRKPRRRPRGIAMQLLGQVYPAGVEMQGVWTFEELDAARRLAGCRVRELDAWVHVAGERRPFRAWLEAIEQGRSLRDPLARTLAKMTGNTLWGRFCMDPGFRGSRTIVRMGRRGRLGVEKAPRKGAPVPAHDLAETVSGRVRARLFEAMVRAGEGLLCAHTDGLWSLGEEVVGLEGWRVKERARRLELLDPQVYRWWPERPAPWEPSVVYAGVPSELAAESFEAAWARR